MRHESGENICLYTLPNEKKNHASIPNQNKTKKKKKTLHLFNCRQPPRREGKLFINKNYHSLLEKVSLLYFYSQKNLFSKREK
jgi:hypothetical protein